MVNRSLVGRCGLYCGACGIYRAHKDNGEHLKETAKELKCSSEKVRCEGCLALTPNCWGYNCKIVQCLKNNGLDFCYECNQYGDGTCEKFEKLAKDYLKAGVNIRTNLERIKNGNIDQWLLDSEEKYKCPICRKPLTVNTVKRKCYHCGANLFQKL